ncbi:rhomboid family protein [Alkalibaculum bacchi]|mgnify:FL=1|uniref:Rhomboid family protein n=1 Tax=Alkalibaculum bacchi TaxID=645887 RepID=A0A366I6N7_9FIRM|nr:rhomboid family intramembrane serine protease [Alkalibaculum bacchi]RBP64462.1 rhomboid family protein [Alkalibaculum bacchi]
MDWKNKLERKWSPFAIHNLMVYIVTINFSVFVIEYLNLVPSIVDYLYFVPSLFLQGQIWRIITFIFIPPNADVVFILFVLYFYYMIGSSLENEWGTAQFNIYYLFGMIGAIIGSFITEYPATSIYLNLSLFLAFAQIYPEHEILLFGVLPIKVKYLAYLNWFIFAMTILFGAVPLKIFAVFSLINFFIFFYEDFFKNLKLKRQVYKNRKNFQGQIRKFKRK